MRSSGLWALSVITMLLTSIGSAQSEELSAFANTSPDMSVTTLYKRQLDWQIKYSDKRVVICLRARALPWFKHKSTLYSHRFKNITKISSVETLKFSNKVNLVILNLGCESHTVFLRLEYRASSTEFDSIDTPYLRAVQALRLIKRHGHVRVFLVDKAIQSIRSLIRQQNIPNFGEWIRVKGDGSQSTQAELAILRTGIISKQGKPGFNSRYGYIEFALSRRVVQAK